MPCSSTAAPHGVELVVRKVDGVSAEQYAQLRARHADLAHGAQRGVEIFGGEFVGDSGSLEVLHEVANWRATRA